MLRKAAAFAVLIPLSAFAQGSGEDHHHGQGMHGGGAALQGRAGQSAFAAIQEIVAILEADPRTDWSTVNIEALRQHLVDMNNVTLDADVGSEPVKDGIRFTARGSGPVVGSIRRMVSAHAATMSGVSGWTFHAEDIEGGASLTVLVPAQDLQKLSALGFIGVMTRGMHHPEHHMMLARGEPPHP